MRSGARRIPALLRRGGRSPVVGGAAPVNTVAPVASGTVTIGGSLSVTDGTWTDAVSFAYQWLRGGASIGGATANTYTPVAADIGPLIDCVVTATGPGGVAAADSNDLRYLPEQAFRFVYDAARSTILDGSGNPIANGVAAQSITSLGTAGTLSAAAAGNRPIYTADGGADFDNNPILTFDGTDDYLRNTAISWGATVSALQMFAVLRYNTTVNNDRLFEYSNGAAGVIHRQKTGDLIELFAVSGASATSTGTTALTGGRLVGGRWQASTSQSVFVGTTAEDTDATTAGTIADGGQLTIGARGDGALAASFAAALFVADPTVTASKLTDLGAYCSWRFGV